MTLKEKIQSLIATLRSLPEDQRKLLLFWIVGALAVLFFFIGIQLTQRRIGQIQETVRSVDFGQMTSVNPNFQLPKLDSIIEQNSGTDMTTTASEAQTTNITK